MLENSVGSRIHKLVIMVGKTPGVDALEFIIRFTDQRIMKRKTFVMLQTIKTVVILDFSR